MFYCEQKLLDNHETNVFMLFIHNELPVFLRGEKVSEAFLVLSTFRNDLLSAVKILEACLDFLCDFFLSVRMSYAQNPKRQICKGICLIFFIVSERAKLDCILVQQESQFFG